MLVVLQITEQVLLSKSNHQTNNIYRRELLTYIIHHFRPASVRARYWVVSASTFCLCFSLSADAVPHRRSFYGVKDGTRTRNTRNHNPMLYHCATNTIFKREEHDPSHGMHFTLTLTTLITAIPLD